MKFEDDYDEFQFLQELVQRLWHSSQAGRMTATASFDLDYCWDMVEEYTLFAEAREALSVQ